jgi:hypothetical protein
MKRKGATSTLPSGKKTKTEGMYNQFDAPIDTERLGINVSSHPLVESARRDASRAQAVRANIRSGQLNAADDFGWDAIGVGSPIFEPAPQGPGRNVSNSPQVVAARRNALNEISNRANERSRQLTGGVGINDVSYNKNTKMVRKKRFEGPIVGMQHKVGYGIKENDTRYKEFGRYIIHIPSLRKNVINIKYKSGIIINDLPQVTVSKTFADMICDLLDEGILDKTLYNKLDEKEQTYFVHLSKRCEFDTTIGLGLKNTNKQDEEMAKFEIIKGEIIAGNNSPELMQELKRYVLKFLLDGRMSKKVGHDLLYEITCVM